MKKNQAKCWKCKYVWTTRIDNPKSCPRCKIRQDFEVKKKK